MLNCVATVTDYVIFSGLLRKKIYLQKHRVHMLLLKALGQIATKVQNLTPNLTFRTQFIHLLSNKPTERMGGVINVSYPKFRALSIDSSFGHIKTIHLMIQWYLYRSSVFTQKWLPWQPRAKSAMALFLKTIAIVHSICVPIFMLVSQNARNSSFLT